MTLYNLVIKERIGDKSKIYQNYEVSIVSNQIINDKLYEKIIKSLDNQSYETAQEYIYQLKSKLKIVDSFAVKSELPSISPLINYLQELKGKINEVKTQVNTHQIINIMKDKIKYLLSYTRENKWRTLHGSSLRLNSYVNNNLKIKKINKRNIVSLIDNIEKEILYFSTIVNESTLEENDKKYLRKIIKGPRDEINLLQLNLKKEEELARTINEFSEKIKHFDEITPFITLEKIKEERKDKVISFSFYLVISFLILSLAFFSYFFYQWKKKSISFFEEKIIESIKQSLLPFNNHLPSYHGEKFKNEIDKIHNFLHRQINLGKIMGQVINYPAILLNSKQEVIWINDSFLSIIRFSDEQLNDLEDGKISLHKIEKYLNFYFDDFFLSIKEKNKDEVFFSQISLNLPNQTKSIPFELALKKCDGPLDCSYILTLYPLSQIEKSAEFRLEQMNESMKKVVSIFRFSYENKTTPQNAHKILSNIFNQETTETTLQLVDKIIKEKIDLVKTIQDQELEISDYKQLFNKIKNSSYDLQNNHKVLLSDSSTIKNSLAQLMANIEKIPLEETNSKVKNIKIDQLFDHLLKKTEVIFDNINHLLENHSKNKENRQELKITRNKLSQFQELKLDHLKIKEIESLLGQLDIFLSKQDLIFLEKEKIKSIESDIHYALKSIKEYINFFNLFYQETKNSIEQVSKDINESYNFFGLHKKHHLQVKQDLNHILMLQVSEENIDSSV